MCLTDVSNSSVSDSDTMANNAMSNNAVSNNATVGDAMTSNSSGEGCSAVVSDLSDVTIDVVGVVVHVLDTAVGQVDGVVTLPGGGAIVRLLSVEPRSRVVVSNSVLVGVGGDLGEVVVADSMGDGVSDSMGDRVCHCVHHGGSNCHSVTNSVTHDTMAKSVAKELRGRGGGGGEGSDAKEGLVGRKY